MEAHDLVREVSEAVARELRERLPDGGGPDDVDADRLGAEAADWVVSAMYASVGGSPLARRIGPVYTTEDLARWLVAPGRDPLTTQAVRKRAKQRRLVGFLTDDRQWAFPAWQFDRAAGRLVPRREVVALWGRLPHDSFLSAADLAAWMNTRLEALGATPAERADRYGADDDAVAAAVSRLRARAA